MRTLLRTLLITCLAATACTPAIPAYDLTPTLQTGTEGSATFHLNREALVILGNDRMRTRMEGTLNVVITTGGALGSDSVVLSATHTDLTMQREAEGERVTLTTAGGIPDTLTTAFAHEGVARIVTFAPDHSVTDNPQPAVNSDIDLLLDPLRWAPADPVRVGAQWSRPLEPRDNGAQWYRTYTLAAVSDGIARITFIHVQDDPLTGDPGDVSRQTRGEQEVDLATGLPYNLRIRDLSHGMIGEDTTVTFHWPDLAVIEP